ncbi:MAG: phage tail tape measure protein [Bacteroidales bacterium]|nr:phage tail tape measure protein [Bacteroidales bacterium]
MANLDIGNLQAKLTMDTSEFQKGVSKAESGVGGLGAQLAAFGKAAVIPIAAVAAAFVALGAAAVKSADTVDQAMRTIRVGTGATGDALEAMGQNLRNVLRQVPDDAATVGTAIAELNTRLGLTGDALEEATIQFTTLARITGTDVKTNIVAVTRLFGDFGVATENQAEMLDYLFRVSQATGPSVDRLATVATQYGTSLRGMGFDLETTIAMLGKFEKEGVNTETVLSSLKIGMANMAREGVTDAKTAFALLLDSIKNAPSDLDATNKAIEVFGQRASADMAMAIREGRFEFDELMDAIDTSDDTILQAAKDSETLGDKIGILTNRATLAIEPFGASLIDAFSSAFDWFDANGETMFRPLIDGFTWLADTFKPFVDMYNKFWGEQAGKMAEFWETDGATVMQALDNIRAAFQILIERLAEWWEWLWPYMEGIYGPALDALLAAVGVFAALFAGDWEKLGERLVDLTLSIMDLVYGVFALGFDLIIGGFVAFANVVSEVMTGMANAILGTIETALNNAINAINEYIKKANEVFGTSFSLIGNVSLTRIVATKIEAPKLSELTGGKTPSELIREALGIEVSEEEAITPDTVPTTTAPTTTGAPARVATPTTAAPASTATPTAAAPAITTTTEAATETATVATTTAVDLSEISTGLAALSPAPVVEAIWELKDALVGMLSETRVVDGEMQATSIAAMLAHVGAALAASPLDVANILPDVPVSRVGEDAIAGGDLYITTQIDGYKVGEAIFRNYNRRTGGGLNG